MSDDVYEVEEERGAAGAERGAAAEETAKTPRPRPAEFGARVVAIYNEYEAALARIQRDAVQREEAAVAACAKAVQSAQRDGSGTTRDAYLTYVTAFHRAEIKPDDTPVSDVYRAQLQFEEAQQQASESAGESTDAANRECAKEIERIRGDIRAEWESAYRDYVTALCESIGGFDAAEVDPSGLSVAGQSMMLAAVSAESGRTAAVAAAAAGTW
jgi:hypothetical protein